MITPTTAAGWTRQRVREALRFSLSRRDRFLPPLAEIRNFDVPGPRGPLDVRFYRPKGSGEVGPLLVFFHGGGFVSCDLDTHDALCTRLADAGKFRVLSCSYGLAPEHPFPSQVQDALACAWWAISHAESLGADAARIGIGGDSAGGYLAATTAARMPGQFKAQILIYPLMQLDDDVWAGAMVSDVRILGRLVVRAIDSSLGDGVHAPSLLAEGALAPLPTLIAAGAHLDPCRPDALAAKQALEAQGAAVTYRDYPGLTHGFGNLTHLFHAARRAAQDIGELAAQLLGAP